ncbi:Probable L-type lectin-domain containing receptor kinase S.5 [Linum perenne]
MIEPYSPLKLSIIIFIIITTCPQVSCLYFNYTALPDDTNHDIVQSASYIAANTIQFAPDFATNKSGRVFYRVPFRISAPFDTTFVLKFGGRTNPVGEGLAFILTGNLAPPSNSSGKWLGIANSTAGGRIVAVEFDARKSYREDLDDNHVGLDINGVYSVRQVSLSGFGVNLASPEAVRARVRYDGHNLTVFVGPRLERLVLSHPIDLTDHLPEVVHVGFSGSTSQFAQQRCVQSWQFSGSDVRSGHRVWWVWFVIPIGSIGLIIGALRFIYHRIKLARKKKAEAEDDEEDDHPSIEKAIEGSSTDPKKFKLDELIDATGNFHSKNKLGEGGFGVVYKGILGNNHIVAVKKVSQKVSSRGKEEFKSEVTTIGNLRHKNLVKLIGWAHERREYLLVYEYMPNGSLDKFIFAPRSSSSVLSWGTRLGIITGVAQALEYLHNGCERKVLHRDVKASNVMLDSKFTPKLGDFGLARTIIQPEVLAGTPGYMAPELFLTGRFTPETDVYAFGILILEVTSGRRPGGGSGQLYQYDDYVSNIVRWVWELHGTGRLIDAGDRRMAIANFEEDEMCRVLALGLGCCHPDPYRRPSMENVLQVLTREEVVVSAEVSPEMPAFTWPPDVPIERRRLHPFTEIVSR